MGNRLRKKIFSAVCLLLVSAVLLGSVSYAWLVLSARPEVTSVTTNISANGTLEIALGKNIDESRVGDASEKAGAVWANRTWGNLIDLTDESYGLQVISLRPAMLNSAGGAVNTLHPLAAPVYGQDGRVEKIYGNNIFAGTYDGERFVSSVNEYGVRGIGAAVYSAPGNLGTFGPPSQRQEEYYEALNDLWHMTGNSYISLCEISERVLMAYCRDGTGVSAGDFNLNTFADYVENVVAAANEELRLNFTLLATAEATSSENYFAAKELLQEVYPDYEAVLSLVDSAIRASGAVKAREAIVELRTFQDASARLRSVVDSGTIDDSDGYSMEEIAQTVGLIFDLEKTSFSSTSKDYWSKVIPNLHYREYLSGKYWWWDYLDDNDFAVNDLTDSLDNGEAQDDGNRETVANSIRERLYTIYSSLLLAELNQAIVDLYVSHWTYWDNYAAEYQYKLDLETEASLLSAAVVEMHKAMTKNSEEIRELEQQLEATETPDEAATIQSQLQEKQTQASSLSNQMSTLTAEHLSKINALSEEKERLQPRTELLTSQELYAPDDSRLEAIRSVITDTIEAMRQYTLWSIAYYACDGQVPDDAYHRIQEIVESTEYIHPRTVYQTLCNYGVTPVSELTQMVEAFEKLEKELLFLPGEYGDGQMLLWTELEAALERIFGTITHKFTFNGQIYEENLYVGNYYEEYSPEAAAAPVEVIERIREETQECEIESSFVVYAHTIYYEDKQLWAQSLNLLCSLYQGYYGYGGETSAYILEDQQFRVYYDISCTDGFYFDISLSVGTEENFNESGLTVRQTRFREAQENISYYQNQLVTAAVNADQSLVTLLMDMIAGQDSFSTATLSAYLTALQQQAEYADELLYRAALAMAASDYADDALYRYAYSSSAPRDAAGLIRQLQNYSFDETVLAAFTERLGLLNYQESLLNQSLELLAKAGAQVTAAEAAAILDPVLDTGTMILYGYVEDAREPGSTAPATYQHTLLYEGFGAPAVQVSGTQAVIGGADPVSIYPDVYLALGRSLSGALLALAKPQVELYAPPTGSVSAEDIAKTETGLNRKGYSIGAGAGLTTVNLCTMDMLYALDTDLWTYTGNTGYISAGNEIVDLYGYCVDLSLRTNAVGSDLLLQTDAVNRIYDGETVQTDTAMGAGSYMEFTVADYASYTMDMAKDYISCLRVAITDANTGYIYAYAALDMNGAEVLGLKIKAPLRLYAKADGQMLTGEDAQYICRMDQNLEKNLSVYVYLDGAKASQDIASAYEGNSLTGVLNLQFSSSADLQPAVVEKLR